MHFRLVPQSRRFSWRALRGRCRLCLIAGLVALTLAGSHGIWAARRFGRRGSDAQAFDQPLVRLAAQLTHPPAGLRGIEPRNNEELYLVTVISDQQDTLFGLTVFVLRMIGTVTAAGIGLVLLTAGATEWEIRSATVPSDQAVAG
jgi:hypothetical protein